MVRGLMVSTLRLPEPWQQSKLRELHRAVNQVETANQSPASAPKATPAGDASADLRLVFSLT